MAIHAFSHRRYLVALLLAVSVSACTKSCQAPLPSATQELKKGKMIFAFDPKIVSEFEIAKADPRTGDQWSAKVKKNNGQWEIVASGRELLDRHAQGGYIEHLLDTLQTVTVTDFAGDGPAESFGLVPPRFALRWLGNELRIGAPVRDGSESYAQIGERVVMVKGAALQMLGVLENFDHLRQITLLAPYAADDFDEVELFRGKTLELYAQREGDSFTDRNHKPVKAKVGELLELLTHARIQTFIDDPAMSQKLSSAVQERPERSIVLKDRHANETRLSLAWQVVQGEEGLYGVVSSRPGKVFRVFPELLRKIEALKN